jgi:hypothetical protein
MTPSTRGKGPWELIWQSDPLELTDARRLELNLKRQKGGNGFYQITGCTSLRRSLPAEAGQPPQPNYLLREGVCANFTRSIERESHDPE